MNDLKNLTILVTRPSPQGDSLCAAITECGGHAIHFPTLAFAPPKDEHAFHQAIQKIREQDWLIFISPQAVYSSIPLIRRTWPNFPETVQWAAVGEGTAKALQQAGYNAILYPDKEQNSEALLDLPAFQEVAGNKIAIIRGEGGREFIDKTLAERGATLLPVIAYQRILPDLDTRDCLQKLSQHAIDMVVCTSFESVNNLRILLGEKGWPYLQEIPVIVMSERIKKLAQDAGLRRIWVTRNPSETALLETMAEIGKILK